MNERPACAGDFQFRYVLEFLKHVMKSRLIKTIVIFFLTFIDLRSDLPSSSNKKREKQDFQIASISFFHIEKSTEWQR